MTNRRRLSTVITILLAMSLHETSHAQDRAAMALAGDYPSAEALVRAHQWDEALAAINVLLKREPANAKLLNLAGLAFTGKGDLKEADEYFRRTLAVNPGFAPSLKNLGLNEFTLREIRSAEQHLQEALKQVPNDPVVNLYLGEIAYQQHKFGQSADLFQKAGGFLSRDPNIRARLAISLLETGKQDEAVALLDQLPPETLTSQSQFALGLALAQKDQSSHAITYLEPVHRNYPDSYNAGFDLAITLVTAKDYAKAITVANAVISHGHETDELDSVLAEAYEGNKETQPAIDALRRAIALNPSNEDNYLDFATICMDHRAFDEGLKVLQVGLQQRPNSDRLTFERGILYAMEDQFDLAQKDFEESAKLAPQSNFGYVGMGVTYLETGDATRAVQLLRKRIHEQPDDASLLYLLAEGLIRSGAKPGDPEYKEAQVTLEKSVRVNPALCLPHVSLGNIYLEQENYVGAVNQLEQARLIDPKEKSVYSHLAVAYRRLGKVEESKRTLNLLRDINERERQGSRDKMKPEDAIPIQSQTINPI